MNPSGSRGAVAPARRRGLADEVADRLRDAIFDGGYEPGAQLREVDLSAALGVSRGPVREALLRLEHEGLVRSEWHRGATVTALSAADIDELHSLRGALERLAVQQVCANATADDLAAVERAAERMAGVSDEHTMVRRDIAFHDAVYAAARHDRLAQAWQAIRSQVHLFLLTRIGAGATASASLRRVGTDVYLAHMPAEHRELAAALCERDAEAATELFAVHRRHAFDVLTGGEP